MNGQQIFLTGLRGTGKTTVGRLVAARLALPFVDADIELEHRSGRSIAEIFASGGEATFRDLEEQTLSEIVTRGPAVVATGGGVVLREANRQRMKRAGKVIWLTADTDTLWRRLQGDETSAERRPNLGAGGRVELEQTLRERETLYRTCAEAVVSTQERSPEQIAEAIVALCKISS